MKKQEPAKMMTRLLDGLNLPKDVMLGDAIVTMTGRRELEIENYCSILEYGDGLIRLLLKHGQIRISGKGLNMDYYTAYGMKISGRIDKIEYDF